MRNTSAPPSPVGNRKKFAFGFGDAELFRSAHNLFQLLKLLALLVDEQLRVTDDVDEQDMADLEFYVGEMLGGHGLGSIWKAET